MSVAEMGVYSVASKGVPTVVNLARVVAAPMVAQTGEEMVLVKVCL
jgi:hypothetical protein